MNSSTPNLPASLSIFAGSAKCRWECRRLEQNGQLQTYFAIGWRWSYRSNLTITFQRIIISMFYLIIILFLSLPAAALSNLAAERSALLSFRSAVGGRTRFWNTSFQTPCQWPGVECNDDTVTALRLPGYSLSGHIPIGTVGKLTGLKTLSLRFNKLSGSLPSDLSSCSELRSLYLYGNRLSGELPEFLFTLNRLVRVNLAGNEFSGNIPIGFNNLFRIRTLYLDHNELTGSIPDLILSNLAQFNVSYNRLTGSIPKSLLSMPANSFIGNSLCNGPFKPCSINTTTTAPQTISPSHVNITFNNTMNNTNKKGIPGGVAIIIVSILVFIFLILVLFFFCCYKKSNNQKTSPVINEISGREENKIVFFGNSDWVFDLEDLLSSSAEVLGKGMLGTAYKVVLETGYTVAVKRLKEVPLSEVEFTKKIQVVGAMDHQNLVSIRGYHYSKEEKLILFDFMPIGSLSALLHFGNTPLNWEKRLNIALGSARGIEYIHNKIPQISHGNIKSSNILLTKSNEVRVSDFCLNHLIRPSSSSSNLTRFSGYRAPEVIEPHRVSQQADVYSFGVLVMELVTGKAPTNGLMNKDGFDLPRWIRSIVKERWINEVFDNKLTKSDSVEEEEEKMVRLLQLAVDCTAQYPDMRPSISEVRYKIEDLLWDPEF
ncbi:probable inactive receptor kinase RLK902 [Impatiens glandulifera]|uniref:probable inactive receptor kinase RLK902 n=1 Tax=Impatiens glandulifera TaxID=253017 RepID=UPI001FB11D29|nr:probable inactive receptor kinase RLK902 [Impatiens glandulifera]